MRILSNFSEVLSDLILEANLTTDELGKRLGTNGANIRYWKEGKHGLALESALKLADFFQCSLEFLMGRTDVRLDFSPRTCPPFYDRLIEVMKQKGKSRYRVVKDTAFSNGYFSRWKSGSQPTVETLIDLANYFDCTLDFLVGREN